MNKKNKILVGCLALLLALSVGYALFSETITINGTATAKGSFDLTTTCQPGFSQDVLDALAISYGAAAGTITDPNAMQQGYEDGECKVNGNSVSISTTLKYPSAERYYTVTIKNTGTIDAVIRSDIWHDPVQTIKVYDMKTDKLVATYNEPKLQYVRFRQFGDGSFGVGKNLDGDYSCESAEQYNQNGMVMKDNEGISYLRIKPGETFFVALKAQWDKDVTDSSQYSTVDATVTLPFTQVTSDMVEVTDGEVLF